MYKYKLYGKIYKTFRFPSVRSTNNFLANNKAWGMLGSTSKWIHVARMTDMGV